MNAENEKTLIQKHPLCWEAFGADSAGLVEMFGMECDNGWFDLLDRLMGRINAHLEEKYAAVGRDPEYPFRVGQIKEKYGTLRFYVFGADDVIYRMIHEAETESGRICEQCGKPGLLHVTTDGYWLKTLCPGCADQISYVPYVDSGDDEPSSRPASTMLFTDLKRQEADHLNQTFRTTDGET
jgi:hypothetical protein